MQLQHEGDNDRSGESPGVDLHIHSEDDDLDHDQGAARSSKSTRTIQLR